MTLPMAVDVIVPCYNTERYLGEALESILMQVPAPTEVIVVDDGSEDASPAVVERFRGSVRLLRQPHRGAGAARNLGVAQSRGDVVAFLDADDVWTEGSLACRLHVLTADPRCDAVHGLTEQFISAELPAAIRERLVCPAGESAGQVPGAMVVRRRAVERIGGFDESLQLAEVVDWFARARSSGIAFRMLDRVVLRRRIHDRNSGFSNRQRRSEYVHVLKAALDRRRGRTAPAEPNDNL